MSRERSAAEEFAAAVDRLFELEGWTTVSGTNKKGGDPVIKIPGTCEVIVT
jgi:hypothetical protein